MEKGTKEYYEYNGNMRLTLAYILADICEAMLMDSLDFRKKAGLPGLRYEQKLNWKGFLKHSRKLREIMAETREDPGFYADTCELLQDLFLAVVDRCGEGEENNPIQKIQEYVLSFPSKRDIDLGV